MVPATIRTDEMDNGGEGRQRETKGSGTAMKSVQALLSAKGPTPLSAHVDSVGPYEIGPRPQRVYGRARN